MGAVAISIGVGLSEADERRPPRCEGTPAAKKPPNITFDSRGQLKMIDFDEAVCFDPKFANLTQSRMLKDFGTAQLI